MRSPDEIRADLSTEEGRGALGRLSPIGRLVNDVPDLLRVIEDVEALIEHADVIGDYIHVDVLRAALAPARSTK